MFPFFNKNFFQSMMGEQRTIEVKAPNGGVYRYTTNTLDEETFKDYQRKLEESVKNNNQEEFDSIWNSLTQKTGLNPNLESEYKKFHSEMEKLLEETNSFFKNGRSLLNEKLRPQITQENIDEKINSYKNKIEELEKLKVNIDVEKKKSDIKDQIAQHKVKMDEKLLEFSKNLENKEIMDQLSNELTEINRQIKALEAELQGM